MDSPKEKAKQILEGGLLTALAQEIMVGMVNEAMSSHLNDKDEAFNAIQRHAGFESGFNMLYQSLVRLADDEPGETTEG